MRHVTSCVTRQVPQHADFLVLFLISVSTLYSTQVALQEQSAQLTSTLPPSTSSGMLRFEVPLSRGGPPGGVLPGSPSLPGFNALQWLQGQEVLRSSLHCVYFSGRHSTAPDTLGTAAAEAAADGWGALAGLGAAWLWQGSARRGFDAGVMGGMTRFLSENQPRLRVVGGSRCGCLCWWLTTATASVPGTWRGSSVSSVVLIRFCFLAQQQSQPQ